MGTDGSFVMEIPTFPRAEETVSLLGEFVQRVDRRVTFDEAGAAELHLTAQRSGALRVRVSAGLEHEIVTYPGVNHAFFNATGDNYNKDQAEEAYAKVLAWFDAHLA